MQIDIPDQELRGVDLTPETVRLSIALDLYQDGKSTLGQAAKIAALSVTQFLHELGRRRIPVNYGPEAFREDLETLKHFAA